MGIVVFLFTFIPGYQATIQAREVKVAWLYARLGTKPASYGIIEWFLLSGNFDVLSDVWVDWEEWFRNLIETHALAPVLAFVPTVHSGQTWLVAAATILDAASFCISALDAKGLPSAGLCHTTGVAALRLIAAELADHRIADADVAALEPCSLTRPAFDAACDRLAALGASVKADRDECWHRFTALLREYEVVLSKLANRLLIPVESIRF